MYEPVGGGGERQHHHEASTKLGIGMLVHNPADPGAVAHLADGGDVQPALARGELEAVSNQPLIGRDSTEVALRLSRWIVRIAASNSPVPTGRGVAVHTDAYDAKRLGLLRMAIAAFQGRRSP